MAESRPLRALVARARRGAALAAAVLAVGCSAPDGGSTGGATPLVPQHLRPPSLAIPANPLTGAAAPDDARERASFWRYALDPGRPVRAIVLLVPGTSGGAGTFDYLAREVVRQSGGDVEVWALDRRSNLLEDTTGMEAAERERDERIALDYYLGGGEVDGRRFAGFPASGDLSFVSEFGLAAVMADLHAALELVPSDRRATNVFVGGHSLGAAQTMLFLAWDYDGDERTVADAGYANVAGGILIEGTAFGRRGPSLTQDEYEAELAALRAGEAPVIGGFPGITPAVLALLEVAGMGAHPLFDDPADPEDGPDGRSIVADTPLPADVETLLDFLIPAEPLAALAGAAPGFRDFDLTAEAFLGLVLDDQFQIVGAEQASVGFVAPADRVAPKRLAGIPLAGFYGLADTAPRYTWLDDDEVEGVPFTTPGEEVSRIERLAEVQFRGPQNFAEWYFATRPSLDADAVGALSALGRESWQAREHGLTAFHAARIDVPMLALGGGSGLTPSAEAFAQVRSTIADPARNGAPRASGEAFRVVIVPGANHLDVLVADDERPGGNGFFSALVDFVLANAEGTVAVPAGAGLTPSVDPS